MISALLAFAVAPVQSKVSGRVKSRCCATMQSGSQQNGCDHHQAPKSDQDKQCCAGCVFCLVTLLPATTVFLYPPQKEESLATLAVGEHVRFDRPPVPPPRA